MQEILNGAATRLKLAGIEEPYHEAVDLLAHILHVGRNDIYLKQCTDIGMDELNRYEAILEKRVTGIPNAYLIGSVEFMGIPITVDRNVLIPRPETELLVEHVVNAAGSISRHDRALSILDVCTGSGAIAISLARMLPHAVVTAADVSMNALSVAGDNIKKFSLEDRIHIVCCDTLRGFTAKKRYFDIIAANPPYIPSGDIQGLSSEVRHEPFAALDGGTDGLSVSSRIAEMSAELITSGGYLFMEISPGQDGPLQAILDENHAQKIRILKDYAGHDRIIEARF